VEHITFVIAAAFTVLALAVAYFTGDVAHIVHVTAVGFVLNLIVRIVIFASTLRCQVKMLRMSGLDLRSSMAHVPEASNPMARASGLFRLSPSTNDLQRTVEQVQVVMIVVW
jgi:hypothetical protein